MYKAPTPNETSFDWDIRLEEMQLHIIYKEMEH